MSIPTDSFGSPEEKNWFVLEQKTASENPWFKLLQSRVRMANGNDTTYHTLDFIKHGVGVVARRSSEILLIRQYRFIIDAFVWAIPSGGVERGEEMRSAAARELVEETGYEAVHLEPLMSYYPSYGCGNQEFHIFLGEEITHRPELFDHNEVLEVKWFPEEEVQEMIRAGNMVDGLSLTPLLYLFAHMKP